MVFFNTLILFPARSNDDRVLRQQIIILCPFALLLGVASFQQNQNLILKQKGNSIEQDVAFEFQTNA